MRKFMAAMMAFSLLFVSTVPTAAAVVCDMPDMAGAMQAMDVIPSINGQDCFIECACSIDTQLDGMPHQLAPHALSAGYDAIAWLAGGAIAMPEPMAVPWLLPLYPPPPRMS